MSTEDRVNEAMSDLIIANMHECYKDANLPEIKGVHLKNSTAPSSEAFFDGWSSALKAVVAEFVLGHEDDEEFNKLLNETREFVHETLKDNPTDETLQALVHTQLCAKMFQYIRAKCGGVQITGLEGDELNSPPNTELRVPVIDSLAEVVSSPQHASTPSQREADATITIRDAGCDRSIPTGICPPMLSINNVHGGGFRPGELIAIGAINRNPISKSNLTEFIQENIQRRQVVKEEMLKNGESDTNTTFVRDAPQQQQKYVYDMDLSSIYAYEMLPYRVTLNHKVHYTIIKEDGSGVTTMTVVLSSRKKHLRRLRQLQKAIAHSNGITRQSWKKELQSTKAMHTLLTKHINSGLAIRRSHSEVLKNLGENNENN